MGQCSISETEGWTADFPAGRGQHLWNRDGKLFFLLHTFSFSISPDARLWTGYESGGLYDLLYDE